MELYESIGADYDTGYSHNIFFPPVNPASVRLD